eukprot:sb/3466212/
MGPPGGSRNDISGRMVRHFNIVSVDTFSESIFSTIFNTILDWHFASGVSSSAAIVGKQILPATITLFNEILKNFLPTPSKSHYLFNLRDFSRVVGGILLMKECNDPEILLRLWLHEVYRVFYDRLTDDHDRKLFFSFCKNIVSTNFKQDMDKILAHCKEEGAASVEDEDIRKVLFGNYSAESKTYSEIRNINGLQDTIEEHLNEYNQMSKTPMSFVPFRYAIEHVSKVSRVLLQPNGHVLLAGIGGSGRSSVAKLATHMAGYNLFQIEIGKSYALSEWREDLRSLLFKAGALGEPTVFMFNDNQVKFESMLEDVNMLLNGAEIPNLYPADEKAQVIEKIQAFVQKNNIKV